MNIPTYHSLIHNEWVPTQNTIEVRNPYDGSVVGKVQQTEGDLLEMVVESALRGFKAMRELSSFDRYEILQKIVQGIQDREQELVQLIVKEGGKPIRFARNEVGRAKLTFGWAAEEARRLTGDFLPLDVTPQTRGYVGITRRFPLGVVLGITPFNFPLNLVAHKIAPAIACGNSFILKPAPQTPLTSLLLGEIIRDAGTPAGAFNIVPTSNEAAETLVKEGRIKVLSFTGSARVGWYLKSLAGKKRVILELGGNAGVIVQPDADLNFAIPRLALGAFAHSGQVCISVQRLFVHQEIFEDFLDRFLVEISDAIRMGDPMNPETIVGPMIDIDAAVRAEQWIQEATERGAQVLCGGKRKDQFLEPTVLVDTQPDMKVVCEEVFAPVVVVEPYQDFSSALEMLNNSFYGLQASIFTRDVQKIKEAYQHLEVGSVIVNDYPTFRIDPMPYGGSKDSGFGREGIRYAIEEMTEIKLLVLRF